MTATGHAAPTVWRALLKQLSLLALVFGATGCVYFNGIYNAGSAAHSADRHLERGDEAGAARYFQQSAASAESVLVRHPTSAWRSRALLLAGRGAAYGGDCNAAESRLSEFLGTSSPRPTRDDSLRSVEARIALAACETRLGRPVVARARLDSLVGHRTVRVARLARLWASRAAYAVGDRRGAAAYLAGIDAAPFQWELVGLSMASGEFARAESLLAQRASRGDFREDATRAVRDLWGAGEWDAAERIVAGYDLARAGDANRASLHYALGDLSLRAGRDSMARRHLDLARGLAGRDTVLQSEVRARLALIGMSALSRVDDVDSVLASQPVLLQRSEYVRRLGEHVLLIRMFESAADSTGAALYLAGEVARDSVRSPRAATALFLRVARELPTAPLAPDAWRAAALLQPDSASPWTLTIQRDYPQSAAAAALNGQDPATRADFATTAALLRARWLEITARWTDSVRGLRTIRRSGEGAAPAPVVKRQ
ncbi:MAG TPA: hypothetical protein VE869_17295 [Gemmatimonas sp.]|nr:hypothetical protein [Gemmatimonas sp.]